MRTISTIALFFMLSGAIAQNMKFSGQTDEFYLDFTTANAENNLPVPEIIWKNPVIQNTNIDSRRYKLQLNVRSGKALKEVTVFLNDYPLITQRGFAVVSVKSLNDFERAVDT